MSRLLRILKRDEGFTLVELIVSFAILAVIMLMTALIIRTTGNTYGAISQDINLQYESQTVLSQLQEYVIDCNCDIGVRDDPAGVSDELYVYNVTDGVNKAYKFAVSGASDELVLYAGSNAPGDFVFSGAPQTMSSYVTGFTADISEDGKSVTLTISYELGKKTYTGKQTISFRNKVSNVSGQLQ
jgi:prepilin-type N-terminal cleavage/methylation domain-containing protein